MVYVRFECCLTANILSLSNFVFRPCGIPAGLLCGIPERLLCGIPARLLCGIPTGLLCGIPVGLLCGIPVGLLCGIPTGLLCGIPVGLLCGIPAGLLCGIPTGLMCGIPAGLLCGIPTRIPVTKSVTNPTGLVPHRLCETVSQQSYRTFSLGSRDPGPIGHHSTSVGSSRHFIRAPLVSGARWWHEDWGARPRLPDSVYADPGAHANS